MSGKTPTESTKSEQLEKLKNEFDDTQHNEITILIPKFNVIKTAQIIELLKANKCEIQNIWNILLERIGNEEEPLKSENFKKCLENIKNKVENAFKNLIITLPITDIINKSISFGDQLIVRSSGIEDNESNSNAGGNISKEFIKPDLHKITQAIQEVLLSYFSEKSIQQRCITLSKENTIKELSKPLCLEIIIQQMIFDENFLQNNIFAANTIISGNLLTTEPYGNTEGVTFISASFGLQAGTRSDIATDQYFIDRNSNIFARLANKEFRLAGVATQNEDIKIKPIKNLDFKSTSSLNKDYLEVLKEIATSVEEKNMKNMEVEFIINTQEKKIYLLQARPFLSSFDDQQNPTYVDLKELAADSFIECKVLAAAQLTAFTLANEQEYIAEYTIDEALNKFLDLPKEQQQKVICVFVEIEPEPLSHPMITFRSKNIQILVSNIKKIKEIDKDNEKLVIDIQNEIIIFRKRNQPEPEIHEGWLNHPISSQLSVLALESRDLETTYLSDLEPLNLPGEQLLTNLSDIVNQLDSANNEKFKNYLKCIVRKLMSAYSSCKEIINEDNNSKDLFSNLLLYIHNLSKLDWNNQPKINKLFYLNWLKAYLYQTKDEKLVNNISIKQLLSIKKHQDKKIIDFFSKYKYVADSLLAQLIRVSDYAINDNIKHNYLCMLNFIKDNIQYQNILSQLVLFHGKNKTLFSWFNLTFSEKKKPNEYLTHLKENIEFFKTDRFKLTLLMRALQELDKISSLPFVNYDETSYFVWFSRSNLIRNTFSEKNIQLKLMAINYVYGVINLIDNTIKTIILKPNTENLISEVKKYLVFFEKLINTLQQMVINKHGNNLINGEIINKIYCCKISDKLNTSSFNVNRLLAFYFNKETLANKYEFFYIPDTLGDKFTALHQCSLALLDKLNPLQALNFEVEEIKRNLGTVSLINQKFNYPYIEYIYNQAMRQHSLVMKLIYSVITKKTILHINLCSVNEWNRNDRIKLTLEPLLATNAHINYFSIRSTHLDVHIILQFNESYNTLFLKTIFGIIDTIIYARNWSDKTGDTDTNTRNIINLDSSIYNPYKFNIESTAKIADYVINYSIDNNMYHPLLAYAIKNCSNNEKNISNLLLISISLSKDQRKTVNKNKAIPVDNPYKINVEAYKTAFYFNLISAMLLKGYCFNLASNEIKSFWKEVEYKTSETNEYKDDINYIVEVIKIRFCYFIRLLSEYIKYSKIDLKEIVTKVANTLSNLLDIYSNSTDGNYKIILSWYALIIDELYAYKFTDTENYFKEIFKGENSKPYISTTTIQFFQNLVININPSVSKVKTYKAVNFGFQIPILYKKDLFEKINDYVNKLADENIFYLVEEELVNKDNKTCESLINAKYQIIASLISAFCNGINKNISECFHLDNDDRQSISNLLPLITDLYHNIHKLIKAKVKNDILSNAVQCICLRIKDFCNFFLNNIDEFDDNLKTEFTSLWFMLFEFNKLERKYLNDVDLFSYYPIIAGYSGEYDKNVFYSNNILTPTKIEENILNAYCLHTLYPALKENSSKDDKNLSDKLQITESFKAECMNMLLNNKDNSQLVKAYLSLIKSLKNFVQPIDLINDHQPKASLILKRLIDITNILIACNLTAEDYKELLDIFTKFEIKSTVSNKFFWDNIIGYTYIYYPDMNSRIGQFTNDFKDQINALIDTLNENSKKQKTRLNSERTITEDTDILESPSKKQKIENTYQDNKSTANLLGKFSSIYTSANNSINDTKQENDTDMEISPFI